ncbi:hypothetical protein [Paenisporosarcina indica]|uniref:hypothetical protein n=1 Tax=Paenisporosarcina indica TaxID=650093 RepID=UPI00094F554A|nr:hypothetical protein [Paenisporosarcina indica]
MRYLKNNEGYALLLVLFLIVMFVSVSAVIASASFNHSKQEVTVDINNQTIVAAEMGVDYFKIIGENQYNNVKFTHYNKLIEEINTLYTSANPKFKDLSETEKNARLKLIKDNYLNRIGTELAKFFTNYKNEIPVNPKLHYEIVNNSTELPLDLPTDLPKYEIVGNKVVLTVKVKGVSINEESILTYEMSIPEPELIITPVQSKVTPPWIPPSFADMETTIKNPPTNLPACKDLIPLDNKMCKGDNSLNLKQLNNTTVYTNNYDYGTGNINYSLKKSTFYNNGTWKLHNAIGMSDVTVFSTGSVTVKNIDASSTYFQIKGDFTGDQVQLSNSSFNIVGNFTSTKHFYAVNTNICVNGNVTLEKKTELLNTKIYYTGNLIPSKLAGTNVKKVDVTTLKKECPVKNPNYPEITNPDIPQNPIVSAFWDDPYLEVKY